MDLGFKFNNSLDPGYNIDYICCNALKNYWLYDDMLYDIGPYFYLGMLI